MTAAPIKDATLATVTAAAKLGEVHALVAGNDVDGVAAGRGKDRRRRQGPCRRRRRISNTSSPKHVAPVAAKLMDGHDAFVAPATTTGKNIAPRVAALLDVMQISDILSVEGPDTFTRPIYAGNAIATVKSNDAKKVITVRTTAFEKAAPRGRLRRRSSRSTPAATPAPAASSASKPPRASGPS